MWSNFWQNTWWKKSLPLIYLPYKLFIGRKGQLSVFDFVFFFKQVSFKSGWNSFSIFMHWFPSKYSSEIAAASWQHKQSISYFFYNAHKYTNLNAQHCLCWHCWEKCFPLCYFHLHLYHCCFYLIHVHLFQAHNNINAYCQLNHWVCWYLYLFSSKKFLWISYASSYLREDMLFFKIFSVTVFYINEHMQKIVFQYWRHTQGFSSYLLFKKDF